MCKLPPELVEKILVCLPVKSLQRFQCVAKSWCLSINSKSFVDRHLNLLRSSSFHLIIKDGDAVLTTDLDDLNNTQIVNLPFRCESVYGFSNSCNGLVLVKRDPPILWNPFTTEYKVLSVVSHEYPSVYGFAYDHVNDDYKVVRVVQQWDKARYMWRTLGNEIYSLKSDSWRQIENFPYFLPITRESLNVHVNGALHTRIEWGTGHVSIVAFSVVTETHYKLELPSCNTAATTLGNLGNHLSVVSYHDSHFDVWVMKDYGVMESWTKLISIAQPDINPFETVNLLACTTNCDRILLSCDERKLQWCDWRNRIAKYVPCCEGLPYKFHAQGCVESLVSLSKEKKQTILGT